MIKNKDRKERKVKLEHSIEAITNYKYEREKRQKKEDTRQLKLSKYEFELDFNPKAVTNLKSDNL